MGFSSLLLPTSLLDKYNSINCNLRFNSFICHILAPALFFHWEKGINFFHQQSPWIVFFSHNDGFIWLVCLVGLRKSLQWGSLSEHFWPRHEKDKRRFFSSSDFSWLCHWLAKLNEFHRDTATFECFTSEITTFVESFLNWVTVF